MASAPLSSPDRASIDAVERALAWYVATIAQAPGAPFDARRAEELSAAVRGNVPCGPAVFDQLVTFGRLMHRLAGRAGVPPCNVGDVIVATAMLPPVGSDRPWERDCTVDEATFAKLGFAATSHGIVDAQRNNRDTWRAHTERCRSFIEQAIDVPALGYALVLGVGHAFDVPLANLAQRLDRVVLIDVDDTALGLTAEALLRTSPRAHIETKVLDLTGTNRTMVSCLDELVRGSKDRQSVQASIENYVRSYRVEPPQWLDSNVQADLVISSCVVSQLAWPQRAYALARLQELGPVEGDAERTWSRAWLELELRVQQDHIRACANAARRTVLISDMANRLTALDPRGLEHPTGQKVFTLGVDSLLERIPQSLRIERHMSWLWLRHRPGPSGEPGSWTDVEAVVLYDRLKTIA